MLAYLTPQTWATIQAIVTAAITFWIVYCIHRNDS